MKRLIQMYLYRFLHSVCGWVCFVLSVPVVLAPVLLRIIVPNPSAQPFSAAEALCRAAASGIPVMLCGIGLTVFYHADEKQGYIKNIMPVLERKEALIGARLAVSSLMMLVMYLLIYLLNVIVSLLLFRGRIGFSAEELTACAAAYLLSVAFLSLIDLLTLLTRGTALPIAADVIGAFGMLALPLLVVNMLAERLTPLRNFDAAEFFASTCLRAVWPGTAGLREVIVSLCYLLLTTSAGAAVLRRRDTR